MPHVSCGIVFPLFPTSAVASSSKHCFFEKGTYRSSLFSRPSAVKTSKLRVYTPLRRRYCCSALTIFSICLSTTFSRCFCSFEKLKGLSTLIKHNTASTMTQAARSTLLCKFSFIYTQNSLSLLTITATVCKDTKKKQART